MAASKNKPFVFFFLAIVLVSVFMFVKELQRRRTPSLTVAANKGIASLFTLDGFLVAVFLDGRTCVWDWAWPDIKKLDLAAGTGRSIPLTDGKWAALSKTGDRYLFSVYDINTQKKGLELTAGWGEQDIHLRNAHSNAAPTLMRRNPERDGSIEVEFAAVNLATELLKPPVLVKLDATTQTLRDFAVSEASVVVAVGADDGKGRLLAIDLTTGQTLWDHTLTDAGELTTVTFSLDGQTIWAGDRDGNLQMFTAEDGLQTSKVSALLPGETRTVTNDFSLLNLVVSPDGSRLGFTIAPTAYAADAKTGVVTHRTGSHKVVAKVTFSPDSKKMATADLRADGTIRINTLE